MDANLARKAAQWWASKLNDPKFDNGDKSDTGLFTMMMATISHTEESVDKVQKFEDALTKFLEKIDRKFFSLGVDYGPDAILAEALSEAEIRFGITTLPWKTYMNIQDGKIFVSEGYGAPRVEI